ncbi:MAG TPA: hypothetical protein PLU73_01120 [Bacteroidia bacterium]|nr:hypothetical protein [Bacteroidia bacterium]
MRIAALKSGNKSRKRYFLLTLLFGLFLATTAQKPAKKEAQLLIDKTLTFLKTSDEAAFIQLWHAKNENDPEQQIPFGITEIKEHFKEMKVFLDTVLSSNKSPDKVIIEKLSSVESREFNAKYKLRASFFFSDVYTKEISFYLVYLNDKWAYKYAPDYTIIQGH